MKPLPWSPSALETFTNCPKQFHHRYVLKDLPPEEKTAQQVYGEYVHFAFAERLSPRRLALPPDLREHEELMRLLSAQPGRALIEHRAGLTRALEPCDWKHEQIWCRMVLDYFRVDAVSRRAWIVDYKTGKQHVKFNQLIIYALWAFNAFAYFDEIEVQFYWTRNRTSSPRTWNRADIPGLWNELIGDLRRYRDAFRGDIWQPHPSGLCNGWCPVVDCEHWRPKL